MVFYFLWTAAFHSFTYALISHWLCAPSISAQELAELHKETKLKVANLASEDRYANPLVERIATAMLKLRNQAQ